MIQYDYKAPRYNTGALALDDCDLINTIIQYLVLFCATVYAVHLFSYVGKWMIILLIAALASTLIAYAFVPAGDREGALADIRRNLFLYDLVAIGGYYLISNWAQIDGTLLGVSFGLASGTVMGNTIAGYLPVVLQMIIIIAPITHFFYEIKRIMTYHKKGYGGVTKRERMEQLQRNIVK